MGDVLALATAGIKKTHIMYRANLSYEQVHLYLSELIETEMLIQESTADGVIFKTTDKGREFLVHYHRIKQFLEEPVLTDAPYVSA